MVKDEVDKLIANAIRFLSIDSIEKAHSGHPGLPMGMADVAETLFRYFLHVNPKNPNWENRDRFVLSNGHGSAMLYSLLHLAGFSLTLDDLKNFRQLDSKTPGHPELGVTPGVEATSGPLGQGLAEAVGMALAENLLEKEFNKDDLKIVDHFTYVFLGDGCLMEGISHEAASFAGTHHLNKLIAFWDNNHISIDGNTKDWFNENVSERFRAYGWRVIENVDAYNTEAIYVAISEAKNEKNSPVLICCNTEIGYGSPNLHGTAKVHGSPLGKEEVELTRKNLKWDYEPFEIPEIVYRSFDLKETGKKLEEEWKEKFALYQNKYPELANDFSRRMARKLPDDFEEIFAAYLAKLKAAEPKNMATRKASLECLNYFAPKVSEILGGSADLSESNCTNWQNCVKVTSDATQGNYISYGVREFGMAAIMNGVALHGGFIPFGGTFLAFSTYCLDAIRMSALMNLKTVYVFTHDSIGLGEDGPTHQPINQLLTLRTMPNLSVWRPCNLIETVVAWKMALKNDKPTALILSRQNSGIIPEVAEHIDEIEKGGYILKSEQQALKYVIIATGTEVELAMAVAQDLENNYKIGVRIVSMPSTTSFDLQSEEYKKSVLPANCQKIAIEAASANSWYKYVGENGKIFGIDTFGKSAPADKLYAYFGFTKEKIIANLI